MRLAGENETVVAILGGGVAGGFWGSAGAEEVLAEGLGAKKRDIICCFCFPITVYKGKWRGRRRRPFAAVVLRYLVPGSLPTVCK